MQINELQAYVLRALDNAKGDDLERANRAFGRMRNDELDEQWGCSGETCRQVWQGYKDDRAKHDAALAYVKGLMGVRDL